MGGGLGGGLRGLWAVPTEAAPVGADWGAAGGLAASCLRTCLPVCACVLMHGWCVNVDLLRCPRGRLDVCAAQVRRAWDAGAGVAVLWVLGRCGLCAGRL